MGLCSTVVSAFAIIILSALAVLYRSGHEEFAGTRDDPKPEDLGAIAGTIFTAVIVYAVGPPVRDWAPLPLAVLRSWWTILIQLQGFLVFCGCQGLLHVRENRRGAIAL